MRIELLFLGKTKESYLNSGIKDYARRLSRYVQTDIVIVKEKKAGTKAPADLLMEAESQSLLQSAQGTYVVCLDRSGIQMDSLEFAARMQKWEMQAQKKISFIIGGPLGLSPETLKRADLVLSLSAMTLTHEMARLLLLEQLYRACTIKAGEKYHK